MSGKIALAVLDCQSDSSLAMCAEFCNSAREITRQVWILLDITHGICKIRRALGFTFSFSASRELVLRGKRRLAFAGWFSDPKPQTSSLQQRGRISSGSGQGHGSDSEFNRANLNLLKTKTEETKWT